MRGKWKCPYCNQISSRHWNLKIHIQRKHLGMGVPMHMDAESAITPIFHENSLILLNVLNSTNIRRNYFAGVSTRGPPDALDDVYDYLAQLKQQKQKVGRIENLYRELFPNPFAHAPHPFQVASSYQNFHHKSLIRQYTDHPAPETR